MARLDHTNGVKIKLGLDIHGVIDQAPVFFENFAALPAYFEIHIITGIKEQLDDVVKFKYDKWFSIHQQCEDEGIEITYDEKGRPWVDPDIWDRKKAEYCKREGIHMMIDDSPSYGKYFADLETLYLRLENTQRDNWRSDGQHIDSPVDEDAITLSYTIPGWVVRAGRMVKKIAKVVISPVPALLRKCWYTVVDIFVIPMTNYQYNAEVDKAVQYMMNECEYTGKDSYYASFINRKTNTTYDVWIANKFYAFASQGRKNGKTSWREAMPSRRTMIKLRDLIDKKPNIKNQSLI